MEPEVWSHRNEFSGAIIYASHEFFVCVLAFLIANRAWALSSKLLYICRLLLNYFTFSKVCIINLLMSSRVLIKAWNGSQRTRSTPRPLRSLHPGEMISASEVCLSLTELPTWKWQEVLVVPARWGRKTSLLVTRKQVQTVTSLQAARPQY